MKQLRDMQDLTLPSSDCNSDTLPTELISEPIGVQHFLTSFQHHSNRNASTTYSQAIYSPVYPVVATVIDFFCAGQTALRRSLGLFVACTTLYYLKFSVLSKSASCWWLVSICLKRINQLIVSEKTVRCEKGRLSN